MLDCIVQLTLVPDLCLRMVCYSFPSRNSSLGKFLTRAAYDGYQIPARATGAGVTGPTRSTDGYQGAHQSGANTELPHENVNSGISLIAAKQLGRANREIHRPASAIRDVVQL